jgi:hypothetical protein
VRWLIEKGVNAQIVASAWTGELDEPVDGEAAEA